MRAWGRFQACLTWPQVAAVLGGLVSGGSPQGGYDGDGRRANQTQLNRPQALALTSGPLLFVADSENHRVRKLGPSPPLRKLALGAPSQPSVIACKTSTSGNDRGRASKSLRIACTDEPSSHQPTPQRPGSIQATLSRGRVTYATGTSTNFGGRSMALLLAERRPMAAGRFTLTLRDADQRKPMVQRYTVTIG